jgi:alkanesulfonate monooxygenase SsuD/methylene tetrahydromethanopterin reductase-like flavin-dependent oxidoreductase (luciferase family)
MTELMFGAQLEQSAQRPQDVPAAASAGRAGPHRRDAGESVEALEEAIELVRALWTSKEDVTFNGAHYRLNGAKPEPAPRHEIPIWFGAYQPRLLRATGRPADGWIPSSPFFPPAALTGANQIIDDAAESAGRSPSAVRRGYNIEGVFGSESGFLRGSARERAEQLAELVVNERITAFFLCRVNDPDVLRRFAAELAPAVRDLVA